MIGECISGKRTITFKWRSEATCNFQSSKLPEPIIEDCGKCPKGFYIKEGKCISCPINTYNDKENAAQCQLCSSGKFSMPIFNYNEAETLPIKFETKCQMIHNEHQDLCAYYAEWIVTQGKFLIHPKLKKGVRLTLKRRIAVKEKFGAIKFSYKASDISGSELLKIQVDEVTTGLTLKKTEETFSTSLSEGYHIVEWIYEKLYDIPNNTPLEITSIQIEGEEGSLQYCASCPIGSFMSLEENKCTECKIGMQPNVDGKVL